MRRQWRRPRGYDGCEGTSWHIRDVLPRVMRDISGAFKEHAVDVLAGWPAVIGDQLAPMTRAISFSQGVLIVRVSNSTLYSLLALQQKGILLARLRELFPSVEIDNIVFRMR